MEAIFLYNLYKIVVQRILRGYSESKKIGYFKNYLHKIKNNFHLLLNTEDKLMTAKTKKIANIFYFIIFLAIVILRFVWTK